MRQSNNGIVLRGLHKFGCLSDNSGGLLISHLHFAAKFAQIYAPKTAPKSVFCQIIVIHAICNQSKLPFAHKQLTINNL